MEVQNQMRQMQHNTEITKGNGIRHLKRNFFLKHQPFTTQHTQKCIYMDGSGKSYII